MEENYKNSDFISINTNLENLTYVYNLLIADYMKTTLESLKQGKAPDSGNSDSKVYDVTDN